LILVMARTLHLRTEQGPVDFRARRKQVTLADEDSSKPINRRWLEKLSESTYHRCIKLAMLIGARQMDLEDAQNPANKKSIDMAQVRASLQRLESGHESVDIDGHKKSILKMGQRREERERGLLVKFSKSSCLDRRQRSFIIDNGELVVFKDMHQNAKMMYPSYRLKDATAVPERKVPGTIQKPRFEHNKDSRLRVVFKQRQDQDKSALYLYPKDDMQMKQWKRAFNLAKVLVSDNDRRVLKTYIGHATSASMVKGWRSLMQYFREVDETRKHVRQMGMRLLKVDFSRGWSKLRLVNKKHMDAKQKREEQQLWAARFMSEKLARLGKQHAKTIADLRESIITKIQKSFRTYRDERIFDRNYPIGATHVSRMQQARQGLPLDIALDMVTCNDALLLTLQSQKALAKWGGSVHREAPLEMQTKKATYSEVNIAAGTMHVHVCDNFQTLSLASATRSKDQAAAHLTKADWSNFVNIDRISSVVLHSEPVKGAGASPQDTGVWCTIHGPRVCWGKRIDVQEGGNKPVTKVLGPKDGLIVPRALSEPLPSSKIKWVYCKATVGQAQWALDKLEQKGKSAKAAEDSKVSKGTTISLHMLGWRFVSNITSGDCTGWMLGCA